MSIDKKYISLLVAILLSLVTACEPDRRSSKGLYLPKGSIENGELAFIDLKCNKCHTVANVDLPAFSLETSLINIQLGGEVSRVKSYGELVTAIINPKHTVSAEYLKQLSKDAKEENRGSPMPSFNDEMTVTQLIDLVMFLDSQYTRFMPYYTRNPPGHIALKDK